MELEFDNSLALEYSKRYLVRFIREDYGWEIDAARFEFLEPIKIIYDWIEPQQSKYVQPDNPDLPPVLRDPSLDEVLKPIASRAFKSLMATSYVDKETGKENRNIHIIFRSFKATIPVSWRGAWIITLWIIAISVSILIISTGIILAMSFANPEVFSEVIEVLKGIFGIE